MPYIEGQTIHDADSHIMEPPEFLDGFIEAKFRDQLREMKWYTGPRRLNRKSAEELRANPDLRSEESHPVLLRKNFDAAGSWCREDRALALDNLGFASQLVFPTSFLSVLDLDVKGDRELMCATTRAVNRAMVDFCAADKRLLSVCYVPLADFESAAELARDAIAAGAKSLMIPSRCPKGHSPSHIGLDPLWAQAQEAGLPILFHVGGGGVSLSPDYFKNGLPAVPDFHGGDGNFRSVDYMAIPYPPMQTMATLIIDRVLDRFPRLMFGVIEQGASWLPGWMRALDSAYTAFFKNEERLKKMSMKPSEFVRRQVRVTPYPAEDTGWIIANSGEEICMFSSDYPHVEGGRNPLKRFEAAMAATPERAKRRFYCDNFVSMMGAGLAHELMGQTPPGASL